MKKFQFIWLALGMLFAVGVTIVNVAFTLIGQEVWFALFVVGAMFITMSLIDMRNVVAYIKEDPQKRLRNCVWYLGICFVFEGFWIQEILLTNIVIVITLFLMGFVLWMKQKRKRSG